MISLFYGVPGAGKTQAMQDYVSAHAAEHRFMVLDRAGEWEKSTEETPNPRWRGADSTLPIYQVPARQDLGDFTFEQTGIYLFGYPWEGGEVASLCVALGHCCYVDDELDMAATYKAWNTSDLRHIVHRGRHMPNAKGEICELHMLGAARRPQNLHSDVTTMADQCLIFRVQGRLTLDRLRQDGMIDSDDEWQRIRTMPNLQYKLWRSDGHTEWGSISDAFRADSGIP